MTLTTRRYLTEDELVAAHRAGPAPTHVPAPHELRRAWLTAKQLAEQLEVADQVVLQRIVVYVREQVFIELLAVEGYVEAHDGN